MTSRLHCLIGKICDVLANSPDIAFVYVHGSALERDDPHDIDLAIYLREEAFARYERGGGVSMDFAIPLESTLEIEVGMAVDVQVLNRAPLSFRARVSAQGQVAVDNAPALRDEFEYRSRYEYFDFRPRRQEYLAEVLA